MTVLPQVNQNRQHTRNPLVIHWQAGIKAKGELREQFHHVIDVVPTIPEDGNIPTPTEVNGIKQKPIEGVSIMYSFEDKAAKDTRTTQYFDGKPTFHYNAFELATNTIEGSAALPAGDVQLKVKFKPDAQSKIGGGTLTLMVNGKQVDEGKLERTLFRHGLEPFEVGRDSTTPVDPAYSDKEDFEFSGAIQKVEFDLNQ